MVSLPRFERRRRGWVKRGRKDYRTTVGAVPLHKPRNPASLTTFLVMCQTDLRAGETRAREGRVKVSSSFDFLVLPLQLGPLKDRAFAGGREDQGLTLTSLPAVVSES